MKKILIAALLTLVTFGVDAQITKQTILAGGGVTFNQYRNKDLNIKTTNFSLQQQLAFAFADNVVLGARLGVGTSSSSNNFSFSFAPFARYYVSNFFVHGGFGYIYNGNDGSALLDGEIGYALFLNNTVAIEPALYYNQMFANNSFSSDMGAKLSLQIYFNRN